MRLGGAFGFAADADLAAGETAICWLPERAPAAVALIDTTSSLCAGLAPRQPIDIVAHVEDGLRCWIGLRDGTTLVARTGFDREAPFGVLIPVGGDWSVRSAAAERLQRRLLGARVTPVLPAQARIRFASALRAAAAQEAGASYRDVAGLLFGEARVAAETWPTSALKAQTARLVAHGRWLVADGYRDLLRGRLGRRRLLVRP
jgi:hypothetical protein